MGPTAARGGSGEGGLYTPTQVSHQPVGGECRSADGVRGLPPTRPAIPFFLHQLAATAVAPAARAASQRPLVGRWWGCCRRLALHAPTRGGVVMGPLSRKVVVCVISSYNYHLMCYVYSGL